jgi:NADPH:quinone reductase-like Zn-dependent oxidoreductase
MGAHVTVTCSASAASGLLERLGADRIVNYHTHNFATLLQDERYGEQFA